MKRVPPELSLRNNKKEEEVMIKTISLFIQTEWLLFILLLVSLFPILTLGLLADVASTHLFCSVEKGVDLPLLSKHIYRYFAGSLGFMFFVAVVFWLLSVTWFVISAYKTATSIAFRLQFLSGFLLLGCLFIGLIGLVILAWALPYMPLCAYI